MSYKHYSTRCIPLEEFPLEMRIPLMRSRDRWERLEIEKDELRGVERTIEVTFSYGDNFKFARSKVSY